MLRAIRYTLNTKLGIVKTTTPGFVYYAYSKHREHLETYSCPLRFLTLMMSEFEFKLEFTLQNGIIYEMSPGSVTFYKKQAAIFSYICLPNTIQGAC